MLTKLYYQNYYLILLVFLMSHINGDITRTRELLSQAVQHLDNVNVHHRNASNTDTPEIRNVTRSSSITPTSAHVNLHYTAVPTRSRPTTSRQWPENHDSSERKAIFRPSSRIFRPTFHPAKPAKKRKKTSNVAT